MNSSQTSNTKNMKIKEKNTKTIWSHTNTSNKLYQGLLNQAAALFKPCFMYWLVILLINIWQSTVKNTSCCGLHNICNYLNVLQTLGGTSAPTRLTPVTSWRPAASQKSAATVPHNIKHIRLYRIWVRNMRGNILSELLRLAHGG